MTRNIVNNTTEFETLVAMNGVINAFPNKTLATATQLIDSDYKTILEFGVASGISMGQLRQIFTMEYKIFGFDSFCGLPEDWICDGTVVAYKDCFSFNGKPPCAFPGVELYVGLFSDTVLQYVKNHPHPIGLIHIDCDIHSSTKTALEGITPFIVKGTIISFDDWCVVPPYMTDDIRNHVNGPHQGFIEWALKHDKAFEVFPVVGGELNRRIVKIKN